MLNELSGQRNSMLAAIIDSSEDAIISKTLKGIIISWNKAAEKMFGYTEQEVKGKHISILIPTTRLSEEEMIISNLAQGKKIEHYQTVRRTKSGKEIHISLTVSPIRNEEGTIIGASKIARDISRQKEAEEMIRRYSRQLELINSTGKSIAALLDIQAILQKVTDTTTLLSGAAFGAFFYNKTDATGESFMLYTLSGAKREDFEKLGMPRNTEVFKMTFNGEGVMRSDDITKDPRYGKNAPHHGMPKGHLPVVSYLAVPVMSGSGTVIGGLFFGHPEPGIFKQEHENLVVAISAQAAIALDNAKLYDEINTINAKKDEFISFASHELKTPLTTISGYLQLGEKEPELAGSLFPKIGKQVNRLTAIIADLLDISKIQAGRLELNFATTSLHTLIRESIETVKQQMINHNLEVEMPSDDLFITVDAQKMGQVLINILTNAIKYSAPGTKILLKAIRLGDQIRISIRDEGVGISAKHLDQIYGRFYRVSKTSGKVEGMGLGLYISQEILAGHYGRIWAESKEGKGSIFYIDFPIDQVVQFKG